MDSLNRGAGAAAGEDTGPHERLAELGLQLPRVPKPVGNFELGVLNGETLLLSGQGPLLEDGTLAKGKVGQDIGTEEAYDHARRTGLVLISVMQELLGTLDRVDRVLRVFGMVNAAPDFTDHPEVINGCSDLLRLVFGERGRHARCAVGMGSLPGNISVEIEATVRILPGLSSAE